MNYDESTGQNALREFFNASVSMFGSKFPYPNFDLFLESVRQTKGAKFIDEGLGMSINTNELTGSQVKTAMRALAVQAQGRIPASTGGWFSALNNEAGKVSFIDAGIYTAVETVKTVGQGAAAVGDAVIDTGKSLLAIGPLVAVAAILFIVYSRTKQIAG